MYIKEGKKMKKLVLLTMFLFTLLINNSYAKDVDLKNYLRLTESTVSIMTVYEDDTASVCSGIIIIKNQNITGILTAKHCLLGKVKTIYINLIHKTYKYKLAEIIDVAYIELDKSLQYKYPIPIAKYNGKMNDIVYFLGYPSFKEHFQIGTIYFSGFNNFYIFAKALKGCSGSGIINSEGKLVGIVWGSSTFGHLDTTIATPIKKIKPFLIKLKIWNKLR